jgi:general secretion pathway protein D
MRNSVMQGIICVKRCFTNPISAWGGVVKSLGQVVLLLAVASPGAWAESMTLNLKDADINTVIATVSEMTGKNFIVDPRVKGKVTVISSHPMEAEDIYQVFLAVLNVHGFAAIPGKNVTKIVPEVNAKQDSIPTVTGRSVIEGGQFVTRVVAVTSVAAAERGRLAASLISRPTRRPMPW